MNRSFANISLEGQYSPSLLDGKEALPVFDMDSKENLMPNQETQEKFKELLISYILEWIDNTDLDEAFRKRRQTANQEVLKTVLISISDTLQQYKTEADENLSGSDKTSAELKETVQRIDKTPAELKEIGQEIKKRINLLDPEIMFVETNKLLGEETVENLTQNMDIEISSGITFYVDLFGHITSNCEHSIESPKGWHLRTTVKEKYVHNLDEHSLRVETIMPERESEKLYNVHTLPSK